MINKNKSLKSLSAILMIYFFSTKEQELIKKIF